MDIVLFIETAVPLFSLFLFAAGFIRVILGSLNADVITKNI